MNTCRKTDLIPRAAGFLLACLVLATPALSVAALDTPLDNIQGAAWDTADERYLIHLDGVPSRLRASESQTWCVRVTDAQGIALPNLKLSFTGGMPQHGHGLPNVPATTRKAGANCPYRIDGIEFHMPGVWQVGFVIIDSRGQRHEALRYVNVN